MSQDNPNSQPPSSPEPQNQPPSPPVQPFWKAQTIKILRGTIRTLEGVAVKLETEPPAGTQSGWSVFLGRIRSFLPGNLNQKLSDTALTGIIAGIVVILVWTTSGIFTGKPTEVATVPPAEVETLPPTEVETLPPTEVETLPPTEVETLPPTEVETLPPPEVANVPPAEEAPAIETIPTPPELTAPEPPQPVGITPPPQPEPTPPPTVELTPEQTLIAAIENQVAEVSDRYAAGLIQSIQANFRSSNLTIRVSDDWYNLKQSQQDKLAAQMLERSRELDFTKLEITDSQDTLIARSPVVGENMVIFKRQV
jgi:hypothetical protein